MSVYVGVPRDRINISVNESHHWSDYWTTNGVPSRTQGTKTFTALYGTASRSSGPPTVSAGKPWYPPRPYLRSGLKVGPVDGIMLAKARVNDVWIRTGDPMRISINTAMVNTHLPQCTNAYVPLPLTVNQRNRLITECLLKVGDRKVNYGESLAESRSTIRHLAKTAITLFTAFKQVKKFQFKRAAKTLGISPKRLFNGKEPASRWLEYQFAWMPLVSDIYDTTQLLKKGTTRPQLIRAVRRLEESESLSASNNSNRKVEGMSKKKDECILFYRLRDQDLTIYHQVGLINPAEVAWAILPFSFVVDWFLPVQNVLEASTATMGLTFVGGKLSSKVDASGFLHEFEATSPWIVDQGASNMKIPFAYSGFRREIIISNPRPGLYYKSPFSTSHAISALALLRQLTK